MTTFTFDKLETLVFHSIFQNPYGFFLLIKKKREKKKVFFIHLIF